MTDEYAEQIAEATREAVAAGRELPAIEELEPFTLRFRGRRLRVYGRRSTVPDWFLALDSDLVPVTFALTAIGRAGIPVTGIGETRSEAKVFLLQGLERDWALFTPRGRG